MTHMDAKTKQYKDETNTINKDKEENITKDEKEEENLVGEPVHSVNVEQEEDKALKEIDRKGTFEQYQKRRQEESKRICREKKKEVTDKEKSLKT